MTCKRRKSLRPDPNHDHPRAQCVRVLRASAPASARVRPVVRAHAYEGARITTKRARGTDELAPRACRRARAGTAERARMRPHRAPADERARELRPSSRSHRRARARHADGRARCGCEPRAHPDECARSCGLGRAHPTTRARRRGRAPRPSLRACRRVARSASARRGAACDERALARTQLARVRPGARGTDESRGTAERARLPTSCARMAPSRARTDERARAADELARHRPSARAPTSADEGTRIRPGARVRRLFFVGGESLTGPYTLATMSSEDTRATPPWRVVLNCLLPS